MIYAPFDMTRSNLRRELLRLYFSNPEQKYYLRELERALGLSVANIRRELLKLEKTGLFKRKKVGNLLYYYLDRSYPLYEELRNMVFKTIGIAGSLKSIFDRLEGVEQALIYGSYAAGEETGASDIDVLVIGSPDEEALMELIEELEHKLKREINYTIYSRSEYEGRKTRGDSLARNIMERPKIMIKGNEDEL